MVLVPPSPSLMHLAARSETRRRAAALGPRSTIPHLASLLDRPDVKGAVAAAYRRGGEELAFFELESQAWHVTRGRPRSRAEAFAMAAWLRATLEQDRGFIREAAEEGLLVHHGGPAATSDPEADRLLLMPADRVPALEDSADDDTDEATLDELAALTLI